MNRILGALLAILLVVGLDLVVVFHGSGFPLLTGGTLLPASLSWAAMWAVVGCLAIACTTGIWGRPVGRPGLAALVGAVAVGALAWLAPGPLTDDDVARRVLASMLLDGHFNEAVWGPEAGWVRPAVAVVDGQLAPRVTAMSAVWAIPAVLGVTGLLGALSHGATVLGVSRLVEAEAPGWGGLAAWAWALLPAAILPASTALPHSPTLALLTWALVLRERPWATPLVALALWTRPLGALGLALGVAVWGARSRAIWGAVGVVLGLLGALVFTVLQPGPTLWGMQLDGWRLFGMPLLALVWTQVSMGWPFGLALALLARKPVWAGMAVATLALQAFAIGLGPDWIGPVRVHELLIPVFVASFIGADRLAALVGSPERVRGALVATVVLTVMVPARHQAATLALVAQQAQLPVVEPGTVVHLPRGRVHGKCGKRGSALRMTPLARPDAPVVWRRGAGPTDGRSVRVWQWDSNACRAGLRGAK